VRVGRNATSSSKPAGPRRLPAPKRRLPTLRRTR
jgi:hypothetical protein